MPFAALGLPEPILRGVRSAGYDEPTPIQRQAIPLILPGHDLIAAAQTGSGKTAAFLLPILARLLRSRVRALRALILAPTRELAAQIEASAKSYSRYAAVRVASVFGGTPIAPQERLLRHEGVDLLVATPGRLLDLHGRQSVSLEEVEVLVLDEADRMVDMGFAPDLRRILRLLPEDRQTLMFSATMPRELNAVAREALVEPRRIEVDPPRPAAAIVQRFYPVATERKLDLLDDILERAERVRAIVFARTKRSADRLASRMKARGHVAAVLHGDRSQSQRERALRDFKRGRIDVLIATDIASRGIDVDGVTHVVNFEAPRTPEDYVHRIGRTGRMEASGEAITLFGPEERDRIQAIERFLGRKVERQPTFHDPRSVLRIAGAGTEPRRPGRHGRRATETPQVSPSRPATPPPSGETEARHGRRRRLQIVDRRRRKRL